MSKEGDRQQWAEYYTPEYFSGEGVDSPYPDDQRYLDEEHPIIKSKFKELHRLLEASEPTRHEGRLRLLDLGCGPAHTQKIFESIDPTIDVISTDGFFSVAQMAQQRGTNQVAVSDIRNLPFTDKVFGAVTIWDVIEHVPEVEAARAIRESFRVLNHGGVLAIRAPSKWTWTSKYRRDKGHLWFPTLRGLRRTLTDAGFREEHIFMTTRGFPGTSAYQRITSKGDLYLPFGGGIILALAKKT